MQALCHRNAHGFHRGDTAGQGVALITLEIAHMGTAHGAQMAYRTFEHLHLADAAAAVDAAH